MKSKSAPTNSNRCYDSADLRMFEETTDDVLSALVRMENYPLETGVTEVLRLRIAAAVFECANGGEHDRGALKRRVLAQFHTPATSQRLRAG
jgi:hypothetical protein